MINKRQIPCSTMEVLVDVAAYHDGIMSGVLRHPRSHNPLQFHSMSHLILLVDFLLDQEGCPNDPLPLVKPLPEGVTYIESFKIKVLQRNHASWQGMIIMKDTNRKVSFRSVLEFMQLLDELLGP